MSDSWALIGLGSFFCSVSERYQLANKTERCGVQIDFLFYPDAGGKCMDIELVDAP